MVERVEVLEESECWRLLRGAAVGRVAAHVDGRLAIRPVNFAVDGATVLVRTALGSTVAGLSGHPVVFESDGVVDSPTDDRPDDLVAWSVIVEGVARALVDIDELVTTFGVPLTPWHSSPKPTFVRIEPTEVSGRRFPVADPSLWTSSLGQLRSVAPD